MRALVACGWFGIQTWIGGEAIYKICDVIFQLHPEPATNWLGITGGQFLCFLFFWGINMWVIHRGIDTIRFLLNIKAPLLIALGLLLLIATPIVRVAVLLLVFVKERDLLYVAISALVLAVLLIGALDRGL